MRQTHMAPPGRRTSVAKWRGPLPGRLFTVLADNSTFLLAETILWAPVDYVSSVCTSQKESGYRYGLANKVSGKTSSKADKTVEPLHSNGSQSGGNYSTQWPH